MRRRAHALFAVMLAIAAAYVIHRYLAALSILIVGFGTAEAFASSALPDILEPGTHPEHRGIFHSRRALAVSALLSLLGAILMLSLSMWHYHVLFFGALGYSSHLMLDGMTGRLPR
ncbi:MAG: hypothetical protein AB1665_06335 [Candidatus Thermoplasmatota archaeon]